MNEETNLISLTWHWNRLYKNKGYARIEKDQRQAFFLSFFRFCNTPSRGLQAPVIQTGFSTPEKVSHIFSLLSLLFQNIFSYKPYFHTFSANRPRAFLPYFWKVVSNIYQLRLQYWKAGLSVNDTRKRLRKIH